MRAASTLARVRKVRSPVAALARALGLAARIDVALVRRVRLALRPAVDASVEVDLWTSPLVQTRGADAIALRPDVVALLWAELAGDRAALDAAWAALDAARHDAPPLLRLEERLTWRSLRGDLAEVERELGAVIAAMAADEGRRRDLAAWSARALARLPEAVRTTEAAKVLAAATGSWVAAPASLAALAPSPEGARLAARLGRSEGRVAISVRRVGDVLEVGDPRPPPWVTLEVPRHPLALVVEEDRVVPLARGAVTHVDVKGDPVMLGALDGRRWMLARVGEEPGLDALTSVEGPGGRVAAYLVAPALAVTSAAIVGRDGVPPPPEPAARGQQTQQTQQVAWLDPMGPARPPPRRADGGWEGAITFGGETFHARVVGLDALADVALLALDRPAGTSPLPLERDARQGDAWAAYAPAGEPGAPRGAWRATVAAAWPHLTLRVPEEAGAEALLVPGLPVFVGRAVIGHLRRDALQGEGLAATSARLVAWWVAQVQGSERARDAVVALRFGELREMTGALVAPGVALALDLLERPPEPGQPVALRLPGPARRGEERRLDGGVEARPGGWLLVTFDAAESTGSLSLDTEDIASGEALEVLLCPVYEGQRATSTPARVVDVDRARGLLHLEAREGGGYSLVGGLVVRRGSLVALIDRQGGLESASPAFTVARLIPPQVRDWLKANTLRDGRRPQVEVRLPTTTSTEGLLATSRADAEHGARSYRYESVCGQRWEFVFDAAERAVDAPRLCVDVAVTDAGADTPELEVVVYDGPTLGPWPAASVVEGCRAMTREMPGAVTPADALASDDSFAGVRIYARRLPGLSYAHACRRALRFVTGLLAALDGVARGSLHLHLHLPGVDRFDLGEAARRVDAVVGASGRVAAIDPACDLVELLLAPTPEDEDGRHRIADVAAALECSLAGVYRQGDLDDPLDGQFGTSPERRGRRVEVTGEPHAPVVVVRSRDDRPVRGYVAFYARPEVAPAPVRVRAIGGVARWAVPTTFPRPFVVGAIVEDEGLPLETRVHLPPARREEPA